MEYTGFTLLKNVGKQIKDCMLERGMTKRALAYYSGFSEETLDKILLGEYDDLSVYDLWRIFNELEYKAEICLKEI